jgi:hypothetical protein
MNRVRSTIVAATAGALAVGAWGVAPAAAAPVTAEVERELGGRCTASSTWDLNVEKEGKRIEIDVDVESLRANQKWQVRVWHNGSRIAKVTRVTGRDGELDVDRTVRNKKGKDRITFKAVSSTGEVCRATLRI